MENSPMANLHIDQDVDPIETQEWTDAVESILKNEGAERAHFILEQMVERVRRRGGHLPFNSTTSYENTIPVNQQQPLPGNNDIEQRIRRITRWNAMAMVLRAGKKDLDLGGHLASFMSAVVLYDIGFNHFWKGQTADRDGDLVYTQGHCAPGMYSRAFLEGRLTEAQLDNFRQEVDGQGVSSYPHPWLMPDFWQFPTVSMGLGPLMAIYQARFLKYLESRGLARTPGRKVWCFCGDGEMDEPESLGAISMASREGLDNLIFVINCNLQRLDGPVRGNSKIVQELEGDFRGSGWNVLKVLWGSQWDKLLEKDHGGHLRRAMNECVDGDFQTFKSKDGAYVRKHFFGRSPELLAMVADMTDEAIWELNRGGHDPEKVYAAYYESVNNNNGLPTVILAQTVKGRGMGSAGEAKNTAHQSKKMPLENLRYFRDHYNIPVSDADLESVPYVKFSEDSIEYKHIQTCRAALGGFVPQRVPVTTPLAIPELNAFDAQLTDSGEREFSTTMAMVRMLGTLLKDKNIGQRIVPIVPDESRTFGMEGMFRQYGIWASKGQIYTPQDADQLMFYKEAKDGQMLQEGINEPGAMSSWIAAATSYANNGIAMIPFYIYYSMFGFQRTGDLAWAAGDLRARGFIIGGTAGRTTLNGEGLQHEDGHSHIQAGLIPNCISYDPTYAYELAVIVQDGLRRMYDQQEDVFYYLTVMNENYQHPAMPVGAEADILKGMYLLREANSDATLKVNLLGSGTILREVIAGAELLKTDFGIDADIWSATSLNLLRREGMEVARWNMLHPLETPKLSFVEQQLTRRAVNGEVAPVIAATDYIRAYADQIREYVPARYNVLGTDGFGRSDSRENLRRFFEVNRHYVAIAALSALAQEGKIEHSVVASAIEKYGIDVNKSPSWLV
jgi:pyruvate dehydrogenase E1 component